MSRIRVKMLLLGMPEQKMLSRMMGSVLCFCGRLHIAYQIDGADIQDDEWADDGAEFRTGDEDLDLLSGM